MKLGTKVEDGIMAIKYGKTIIGYKSESQNYFYFGTDSKKLEDATHVTKNELESMFGHNELKLAKASESFKKQVFGF